MELLSVAEDRRTGFVRVLYDTNHLESQLNGLIGLSLM